ncbi:MAG: NAD(P)-dependent alcohol dehydrogenase [Chitinophagaceae bacterium]|nr:NAD(P)-dependent alcohol dehydrogenase [Chitinophagaceae bacterium]
MKAIVYTKYGTPDVLQLKEVNKPVPKDDEILVKVYAASINSWDWDMVRGKPLVVRMWGLFKPKYKIPGCDMAGKIEAIGKSVTKFKPGDEVFGDLCESGFGAFAEYTCAKENALALKSTKMSFEEAAATPQAAMMAVQALRDVIKIKPGQKLLINGAGGAVGTFAVQIAKLYGTEVTGVDHPSKFEMMRCIGFDHLIDYTKEDFTKAGKCYDAILDVRTDRSIFSYYKVLNRHGMYATVGGQLNRILGASLFFRWWLAWFRKKHYRLVAMKANKDLAYMNELFEAGKVKPVIGSVYKLNETAAAFRLFSSGVQKGKIVLVI